MSGNSLLLPNTSSIMIRRNSAIEKRSASTSVASGTSASNSVMILATTSLITGPTNTPSVIPHLSHLNTAANITLDDQSISPALSSSTTTSPMTPMTPISPHIPSGYQTSDICNHSQLFFKNTSSSSTSMSCSHYQHPSIHHPQYQHPNSHHHNVLAAVAAIHPRSSPNEFSPKTDGLPKLPPKPSLSGNLCNNPGIHNCMTGFIVIIYMCMIFR